MKRRSIEDGGSEFLRNFGIYLRTNTHGFITHKSNIDIFTAVRILDLVWNERLIDGQRQSRNGRFKLSGRRVTGQKLLKVDLEFQPMAKCSDVMTKMVNPQELQQQLGVGLLEDSMLCVGVLEGGKDSCQVRMFLYTYQNRRIITAFTKAH
jgi:hypothetical protein